ncbi:armadillo repeat-containing X-linked protein 2 [Anopheles sinensis]|uniref:Armadillo repeat-containing X-linked protein 2 n=1 Tax=Anopheles sinensis TaxID=74873 RepID=A0A084WF37_ANOSI|nr:armadillo repeat-containing X-linked protein 2 [Anopheles sinensis]
MSTCEERLLPSAGASGVYLCIGVFNFTRRKDKRSQRSTKPRNQSKVGNSDHSLAGLGLAMLLVSREKERIQSTQTNSTASSKRVNNKQDQQLAQTAPDRLPRCSRVVVVINIRCFAGVGRCSLSIVWLARRLVHASASLAYPFRVPFPCPEGFGLAGRNNLLVLVLTRLARCVIPKASVTCRVSR